MRILYSLLAYYRVILLIFPTHHLKSQPLIGQNALSTRTQTYTGIVCSMQYDMQYAFGFHSRRKGTLHFLWTILFIKSENCVLTLVVEYDKRITELVWAICVGRLFSLPLNSYFQSILPHLSCDPLIMHHDSYKKP